MHASINNLTNIYEEKNMRESSQLHDSWIFYKVVLLHAFVQSVKFITHTLSLDDKTL